MIFFLDGECHLLKGQFLLQWLALHIFQKKSVGQICVGVFLGFPLFHWSCVRPLPHTTQSWLPWLPRKSGKESIHASYFVLFQNYSSRSPSFEFPYKFLKYLVYIKKKYCWDFDRNCVKTVHHFEKNWPLQQGLPIHEHGMPLHLFRSLISSTDTVEFSMNVSCMFSQVYTLLFCFFWSIMNGTVYLIEVCTHSLLVYRNIIDFCVYLLCPAASWCRLFVLGGFFCTFLGIFCIDKSQICKKGQFYFFPSTLWSCISFSCMTIL